MRRVDREFLDAAGAGDIERCQRALAGGANPDILSGEALLAAVKNQHEGLARALLAAGTKPRSAAVLAAVMRRNPALLERIVCADPALLEYGLRTAIALGNTAAVRLLIQRGARIDHSEIHLLLRRVHDALLDPEVLQAALDQPGCMLAPVRDQLRRCIIESRWAPLQAIRQRLMLQQDAAAWMPDPETFAP